MFYSFSHYLHENVCLIIKQISLMLCISCGERETWQPEKKTRKNAYVFLKSLDEH